MASRITYDHCTCCGSAAISKVLTCTDHTVTGEQFEVWKCTHCTFRFTQHVPDLKHIAPYYHSESYVSHSDTRKGFINQLYHRVRKHTLKKKRDLISAVTGLQQGNLLDVGAGTGAFVHAMKEAGWQVTGLEPDSAARATALTKFGIELNTLQDLPGLDPLSFDAITLWHVLEHVHDLHGYLHTFSRLLKPGGKLIVAVPNYTSYDAQVYQSHWAAYDVPRHLYHFSPKSMRVLMQERGFEIEQLKPMWFDSVYVSMLSEQYKFGKTNMLRAFFKGFISNIKAWFNKERCSSLIYIMRKSDAI